MLLWLQLMPWNVDTISSDGFSKTVINAKPKRKDEDMTEEEREERMRNFIKKYEKDMKKYGMLQKFDDSKRFLQDNMHLACEDTANYLVIWAINLEMEEVRAHDTTVIFTAIVAISLIMEIKVSLVK